MKSAQTNFSTVAIGYFKRIIAEYLRGKCKYLHSHGLHGTIILISRQYSTPNRLSQTTEKKRLDDDAGVVAQTSLGHFLPTLEVKSLSSASLLKEDSMTYRS